MARIYGPAFESAFLVRRGGTGGSSYTRNSAGYSSEGRLCKSPIGAT